MIRSGHMQGFLFTLGCAKASTSKAGLLPLCTSHHGLALPFQTQSSHSNDNFTYCCSNHVEVVHIDSKLARLSSISQDSHFYRNLVSRSCWHVHSYDSSRTTLNVSLASHVQMQDCLTFGGRWMRYRRKSG